MTKESRANEDSSVYASSIYSDDGSTLYASSIIDDDTASTLYASSVYSTRLNDKPSLSVDDLQQLRIVVVGLAAPKLSKAVVHHCLLSVRTLLPKTNQDLKNNQFIEQFRILKNYADLTNLDASLRLQGYRGEPLLKKSIFCSHAPQMLDQRKILLELYFRKLLDSDQHVPLLLNFFDTDKEIEERKHHSTKEGYLMRKEGTKLFGKWVAQYFVLEDVTFNYYNQKGGKRLGSIPLKDMSIGSQSSRYLETTDYRHGLVIKQLLNRHGDDGHMLCAVNDEDRDLWVSALSDAARALDAPPIVAVPAFLSKLSNKKKI
ncbi:uncharacterized protein EV154DRAFT_529125 [Mucor mucedo]|uniref:uncharacterized protein n=1 Tax=Mucor mucedo TaxID=29922 RepID=UPI00221F047E|nr:uncharacterized protein EV154DRAFT_529125 [Mucor mucedo]KAI7872626.1 hypothetical protein EV154DRAFT_529125 [Mucor mucedo]